MILVCELRMRVCCLSSVRRHGRGINGNMKDELVELGYMQVRVRKVFTLERVLEQNHRVGNEFTECVPENRLALADYGPWAKSGHYSIWFCKWSSTGTQHTGLYTIICGCLHVPLAQWVVVTETVSPTEPKHLFYDPIQKKFTNACLKGFGERQN